MRSWIYSIIISLAGVALAACDTIYEYGKCDSFNEPHHINFVLAIDAPSDTRATWEDAEASDEQGVAFENRILPSSLRVAVYNTANEHIGDIEALDYWPIDATGSRYQFHGRVPMALLEDAALREAGTAPLYKFMVYANCQNGENSEIKYSFDDLDMNGGAIPMWGVKQVDISNVLNNRVQELGIISLIRAAAKVEVIIEEALAGCTLDNVTINYHNREGYSLPNGWEVVTRTEELDREMLFRSSRMLHTAPHELIEEVEGRKFVIYLPEYDNTLFADYESKLSVDVTYNSTPMSFPDALQFRSHVGGKPTGEPSNIVRNTIYRFRITKINSGGIVLDYEVADWQRSDNWQWEQVFDYPNYHNPVLPDSATRDGDSSNDIYPSRPEMYYVAPTAETSLNETGAFSCWFQMVSPVDQRWLPTLQTASNICEIRVYKEIDPMTTELVYTTEASEMDTSLKDGSKLVAYDGWYNIKVIPTDPTYTGIARFGITYTQDWMGSGSRYLLINGEDGHIVWPNSGIDHNPRVIDIQQVSN